MSETRKSSSSKAPSSGSKSGSIRITAVDPSGRVKVIKEKSEEKLVVQPSKSTLPAVPENVDIELPPSDKHRADLEAARKQGYNARMVEKRAKEVEKAKKQGRREAMTYKSRRVDDIKTGIEAAGKFREKTKPMVKNVGKALGELAKAPGAAAKGIERTVVDIERAKHRTPSSHHHSSTHHASSRNPSTYDKYKTNTTGTVTARPQAQRKAKPGPGKHDGGLPVKSKKPLGHTTPNAKLHRSAKTLPQTQKVAKVHRSTKPLPQNQKAATVHKARSVNYAMKKRSRK